MTDAIRWIEKHSAECWFLPKQHMFMCVDIQWRNKAGRGSSGDHRWRLFRCNDPHCPAQAIVREADITQMLFPEDAETISAHSPVRGAAARRG